MSDIKNDFESYLIAKGFKQNGSAYIYMHTLEDVCREEKLSWDGLERNIEHILIKYSSVGEKQKQGRKNNKAIHKALNIFFRFIADKNKVEDDVWNDVDPAALCIGVLDPDLLESTMEAANPESREKYINNLKAMGYMLG